MSSKYRKSSVIKPKLPRKRKKALIIHCGRKKYFDTIHLARITGEKYCKFWKESGYEIDFNRGVVLPILVPISFW